ncbi:MAG: Sjogren's syndrome/scleroderma autoantigen 1 family protein [Candidatus Thorarchaeota archaeon]
MAKEPSESDPIARMSSLLLTGATMLSDACPDCHVPLFKKENKIFCPKCNREAVFARSDAEAKQIEHRYSLGETIELLQDILVGKLLALGHQLAATESLDELKRIIQTIDTIVDITLKIANFDQ